MPNPIIHFFDKLEDRVRGYLSHYPIIYALIGGFGIVHFWRGVWHLGDDLHMSSIASLVLSTVVLLMTGLLVSFFIGDNILITGLRKEKKLVEKTEDELEFEMSEMEHLKKHISSIEKNLEEIKNVVNKKK
ncbi:MAG: hypothetical protein WC629_02580 [Candidatus Paceibacterota bacterium]|jgi:hypothetical protein